MQCYADEIVAGAEILAHIVGAETILLAVEDNKPDAGGDDHCCNELRDGRSGHLPHQIPIGRRKQLIEILLNAQVPSGGIPVDIGVLCQNPVLR